MRSEIIISDEVNFAGLERDAIGRVFFWKNRVFRAINYKAVEMVKQIFSSGMIDELIDKDLFPKSWITDYTLDGYGLVLEHKRIPLVTLPYEWSFSMLKDAAITVLKVNLIARKYGYQTTDSHGYNVVFDGTHPMFVDLGSFAKIENKSAGWFAYEEFLRCYYYPLRIWSGGNYHFAHMILTRPLEMRHYNYLLYKNPFYRLLNVTWLDLITTLYYKFRILSAAPAVEIRNRVPKRYADLLIYLRVKRLLPLQSVNFLSLIKKIQKIPPKKHHAVWSWYCDEYYDNDAAIKSSPRYDRITSIIKAYEIESAVDLTGDQGVFSTLLLKHTTIENIIYIDRDETAMDACYLNSKKGNNELKKLSPVLLDFMMPIISAYRESPAERFKSDAVIALAVTHQLILSQHWSADLFLKTISRFSRKYVFVEFMPMGLGNGKTAAPPSWYTIDWFKSLFQKYFNIILVEETEKDRVLFVGELRNESRRIDSLFHLGG